MIGRGPWNGKEKRVLIAGNWKMNGLSASLWEVGAIVRSLKASPAAVDVLVCPPATLISRVATEGIGVVAAGGQDCAVKPSGAFTGDLSAEMLADAGATWSIVGHSERRQYHGESDDLVAEKAKAAWRAGLGAIICLGETEAERDAGRELDVVSRQLAGSIPDAAGGAKTAIAYEPVWAIGTGRTATESDIQKMHAHIRAVLVNRFGTAGAKIDILYGGSVKPDNAKPILAVPEVGGALVGGASLKSVDFLAIIRSAPARR